MRVLIDTNVLFSALLFPSGVVGKAVTRALSSKAVEAFVCDYSIEELITIWMRKKLDPASLHMFLEILKQGASIVKVPTKTVAGEEQIRDPKDVPILRVALAHKMDFVLTGDKDFHQLPFEKPKGISPREFFDLV